MKAGVLLALLMLPGTSAFAQTAGQGSSDPMRLPPVIVNVYKEPDDALRLPVSVTGVPDAVLRDAGARQPSDAQLYSPNTFFSEFTARKLSNARFRGIGSSPANPGITTYVDGVPQLNTNSASIELVDVEQVEFVRGPQSALFGRNTLGGLVHITSRRPPLSKWTGSFTVPAGNRGEWDARGSIAGPVHDKLSFGLTAGRGKRDGYTTNALTGNDLDGRSTSYGKMQLWWAPASEWEARLIVAGERARDGDYALNDLAALRANPFTAARDFEGFTHRDVASATAHAQHSGSRFVFSSTTGVVHWRTRDVTDLDYTPLPFVTRDNAERDVQVSQEVRFASAPGSPARLGGRLSLKWQAGVFAFMQNYDQDAINRFSPFLISPALGFPIDQHSPKAALDDRGIGVYGQVTTTFAENLDLTVGARADHERKEADLNTFYDPAFMPGTVLAQEKGFSNVSPQAALSYRFQAGPMVYASGGRGYKAGGFNSASPAGSESYEEERAWHFETGIKSAFADGRVSASAAFFFIDWNDLQLNVPNPNVPAQIYIANVGGARSRGVELEVHTRPHRSVDLFASFGYTRARFSEGTSSEGVNVSGNRIPNTPDHTVSAGAEYSRELRPSLSLYARGEVWFNGGFEYDDANTARQEAYSLTNFRAGVRARNVFVEGWMKNAFDERYIPIAFAYSNFAPSGFVGEMGAPRRFGVRMGVMF